MSRASGDAGIPGAAVLIADRVVVRYRVGRRLLGGRGGLITPVAGVSLELAAGESLGLVGESGCGKSTLARALAGLVPVWSGRVAVAGRVLSELQGSDLRAARRAVQLIWQDPLGALNPRQTVGAALAEAVAAGGVRGRSACTSQMFRLLAECDLPEQVLAAYPHELSGGQRQRVVIARALAVSPRVVVADEPTSALDLSVQARILALLLRARRERQLALLLISHDLGLIRRSCERVAVMYLGSIVESFPLRPGVEPQHPYSQALALATPSLARAVVRGGSGERVLDPCAGLAGATPVAVPPGCGEAPALLRPPAGCPYHPRCPLTNPACRLELPPLREIGPGHFLRCPVVGTEGTGRSRTFG